MLIYSIQHLHNYLFSTMASVTTVGKFADSHRAKKHKEINEFFDRIIAPEKKSQFNTFVRQLNNAALKNTLSISEAADNSPSVYFPDENTIDDAFDELNEQYNIFDSSDNALKPAFQVYFKTAKVIADFIEVNNDNNNSVAYLHAYKMMVLFGGEVEIKNYFKALDSFLLSHNGFDHTAPVHDALIYGLPTCHPAETKLGLNHWRKMFMAHGCSAVNLFTSAREIEKELGKAPENYKQAMQVAASLQFARAAEYPELAALCKHYKLSEDTFNRCLEIDKHRKKSDILPDIIIDGSDHGHPGYHLLKLPISDPRAYFLGHITNCCQSIDGHAEKCVIDGVTLETNGFYVLVKNIKKMDVAATPLKNGRIDYSHFKIVGQGYAWLSKWGNLTFDSWKNLNHSSPDDGPSAVKKKSDDDVIVPLLTAFSKVATHDYPNIVRVTIGDGDTPDQFDTGIVEEPEKILAGYQYGDSASQYLIYENNARKQLAVNRTKLLMEKLSVTVMNGFGLNEVQSSHFVGTGMIKNISPSLLITNELEHDIESIIVALARDRAFFAEMLTFAPTPNVHSMSPIEEKHAEEAREILRNADPTAIFTQPELLKHFSANKLSLWRALARLSEQGLLTRSNAGILLSHPANVLEKVKAMPVLNRTGLLSNENMLWLNAENAADKNNTPTLVALLNNLEKFEQLTQDNLEALKAATTRFNGYRPNYFYEDINGCIIGLHQLNLLNSISCHVVLSAYSTVDAFNAIICVDGLNLNDPDITEIVITRKFTLKQITHTLSLFKNAGIASTQNVKYFLRLLQDSNQLENEFTIAGLSSVFLQLREHIDQNTLLLERMALRKTNFDYSSLSFALADIMPAFVDDPAGLNRIINEFLTNPNYFNHNLKIFSAIFSLCKSNNIPPDIFLVYARGDMNADTIDKRALLTSLSSLSSAKLFTVENINISNLGDRETSIILQELSSNELLTQSCYNQILRTTSNETTNHKILILNCIRRMYWNRIFNDDNITLLLSLSSEKMLACCEKISKMNFLSDEIFHAVITKFTNTTDAPSPPRMNT